MAKPKRRGKASAAPASSKNVPQVASAKSTRPRRQATQNDILPSIESSASALQETSGNQRKRPRETASDEENDPYENPPSPKRTPTPTLFTIREYRAFREKHPIRP